MEMDSDRIRRTGAPLDSELGAMALISGVLLWIALAMPAMAQTLPSAAAEVLPGARETGGGAFRYFGLLVYDAKLWTAGPRFDAEAPYALGIRYARNIKGLKLAEESVKQWRGMRYGYEDKYAAWEVEMQRIFPDVKPEDELVGVHLPGKGAQFYFNGKPAGEVADGAFARAFFAIWLDERTTEPGLRRALIAEK
jgi:hypothetical protein